VKEGEGGEEESDKEWEENERNRGENNKHLSRLMFQNTNESYTSNNPLI